MAFGFTFAGLCASGCRLVALRVPNFRMLEAGPTVGRLAAVPLLIFSAPYLIMRNTLRGGPLERRRGEVVMVATVIAGCRHGASSAAECLIVIPAGPFPLIAARAVIHPGSGSPAGDERSSSACGFAHDLST
jgi:hypothetical protein